MTEIGRADRSRSAPSLGGPSLGVVTAVLIASIATIGANSLAFGPIAPEVANGFSTDTVSVMVTASAYGVGIAMGALVLSPLIDRLGAARALTFALFALVLTFAASAAAPSLGFLIAAQWLTGLASGLGLPAIYAFTSVVAPPGREAQLLGRVLVGWTLSMVIGVSLSALLADLFSWRWVFAAFAMMTLCALIAVLRMHVPRRVPSTAPLVWPHRTLGIPGVPPLLFICFAYMAAFYGTYGYVGDHVHNELGMPVRTMAMISFAYGVGFGLAAFADPLIDRLGQARVMPWAFMTLMFMYVLLALVSGTLLPLVVASIGWGLLNHFGLNLIVAGLSGIDPSRRGAILGAYSAVTYLSAAVATALAGWLYAAQGFQILAFVGAVLIALSCCLSFTRQAAAIARQAQHL